MNDMTSFGRSDDSGPTGHMKTDLLHSIRTSEPEDDSTDDKTDDNMLVDVASFSDGGLADFNYQDPKGGPSTKFEMLSNTLHDITLKHNIVRVDAGDVRDLFSNASLEKLLDHRTVRKKIKRRTGIKEILYDCCPHSQMSYAMYSDLDNCTHCSHPRWKESDSL